MSQQDLWKLHVPDLSLAEYYHLEEAIGEEDVFLDRSKAAGSRHGALDPVTAVVIISVASLQVLAVWLSKNRKSGRFAEVLKIEHPDGRIEIREVVLETTDETSDADVMQQLMVGLGLPKQVLPNVAE